MDCRLESLPELLNNYLGQDEVIKDKTFTRLTKPGENFGSIMLKLDVLVENKKEKTEKMHHFVAKILPETEMAREMFNIQITYTNEMGFYETIVPTLQNFQKELGIQDIIDSFPKCIATRKNLTGGDKIDDDAVLILENLVVKGYQNIDRVKGFDFETTKIVLKDLALFHAVPLALRITKPDIFHEKIEVFCSDFKPHTMEWMQNTVRDIIKQNDELAPLAAKVTHWGQIERSAPREPFATIIHTDLWTNNTMQKFEDGRPVSNKLVDFQVLTYGSPAADVFFFLWSSVPQEVLEPHLEFFLEYYHEQFVETLKKHRIDVTPFGYDKFLKEMEMEAEYGFGHAALFYLMTASVRKEDEEFREFDGQYILDHLNQRIREKVWYMVRECVRRGWIKN